MRDDSRTGIQPRATQARRMWIRYAAAAAVALAICAGGYLYLRPAQQTIQTALVEQNSVMLPDGSSVTINAASQLSYNAKHFNRNRTVELQGEAIFDVTGDSGFIVNTSRGVVEVLGTRFNVYSRDDRFEVLCMNGKVRTHNTVLEQGDGIILRGSKLKRVRNVPAVDIGSWSSGETRFKDTPRNEVLREMERQFNITFDKQDDKIDELFTGSFVHSDLSLALEMVCRAMGIEYEVKGRVVVLR